MKRFKESVKEYFNFTKNERSGVVWLLIVCVLLLVFWIGEDAFIASQQGNLKITYIEEQEESTTKPKDQEEQQEIEMFYFDPNNLPASEWSKLGLSDKQIKGIHNYEKAGGSFKRKEDVLKMYTISDGMYAELEPYIRIEVAANGLPTRQHSTLITDEPEHSEPIPKRSAIIELNSVDTLELMELKGIGPVFSKNILKYRGLLGGYYSIDQLKEVYGLRDHPEAVDQISVHLMIDTTLIRKIDLNTAEAKDLASHIYIDWNVAKAIVAYRNTHGPYKNVSSVSKCHLVDDALMTKIAPYLKVD